VTERSANGSFRDLFDLCSRVDGAAVNKTALENLTKAGALDSLLPPDGHRGGLFAGIERAIAAGAARLADRKSGQKNLFAAFEEAEPAAEEPVATLPDVPPLTDMEMRSFEKEVITSTAIRWLSTGRSFRPSAPTGQLRLVMPSLAAMW